MATNMSIVHHFTGDLHFVVDGSGNITQLLASTNIDLRDALGQLMVGAAAGPFPLDMWPQLNATQKTQMQNIYTALVAATTPNVTSVS